jgi:hypothetical protein
MCQSRSYKTIYDIIKNVDAIVSLCLPVGNLNRFRRVGPKNPVQRRLYCLYVLCTRLIPFQFERDKKQKGDSLGGLEECLSVLSISEFADEQLQKLCGLQLTEFVELVADQNRKGSYRSNGLWTSGSSNNHEASCSSNNNRVIFEEEGDNQEEEERDRFIPSLAPSPTAPSTTTTSPPTASTSAAMKRASRLKRTQSERVDCPPPFTLPPSASVVAAGAIQKKPATSNMAPASSPRKTPPPLPPPRKGNSTTSSAQQSQPPAPAPATSQQPAAQKPQLVHSMTFTANELDPSNRFLGGKEASARQEVKRKEALWDLFQSEIAFLLDHLMVLKHVSVTGAKK